MSVENILKFILASKHNWCFLFLFLWLWSKLESSNSWCPKITAGVKRRWFFNRCPTELYSSWAIDEQSAQSYEA